MAAFGSPYFMLMFIQKTQDFNHGMNGLSFRFLVHCSWPPEQRLLRVEA
jgi:hypothetical protein